MKDKIKRNFGIISLILITLFYFQYSVTILWDSAHYMNYVNIFEGNLSWNNWDVVRGPVFPVIIYLGNFIFGKTSQGLILNTYIFYIIMLLFCYKILFEFFSDKKLDQKHKKKFILLFIFLLIICNPIIYGFYHSLLTEFVAITLSVISCYYAYKILNVDFFTDKKRYIFLLGLLIFLTIFSWFLKQPYVSCALFAFLTSMVISIFEKFELKNILVRISSILVCISFLIVSIICWDKFLVSTGNNTSTGRNPTNSLGNQFINAIDFIEIVNDEEIYSTKYLNSVKLSKSEKKELLSRKKENYVIVNIYDGKKMIESDYINASNGMVSSVDSLFYILKIFFEKPVDLLESYLTNYLSIIDVYSTFTADSIGYFSDKKFSLNFSNEINSIAFKPYNFGDSNIFYMTDEMYNRVRCYEQVNLPFKILNVIMNKLEFTFLLLFKLLFLLLPFVLIISIIMRIFGKKDNVYNDRFNFIIILLTFSFLHVLLHTVTGAIIDRYAIPAFVTTIIGIFMFFYLLFDMMVKKRRVKKKLKK